MLLETQNLSIGYNERSVATALNLQAKRGEMICMLGQNGCGKSTLLRTLCGLQPALQGSIQFRLTTEEEPIRLEDCGQAQKAKLFALVLTERLSLEHTRVRDVVAMGRYPYASFLGGMSRTDEHIIRTALAQTGMQAKSEEYYNCLSDGEKQRVLIAKALAQQTPLILLDEPTAHLDLPNRIKTLLLLRELAHTEQKCVIISTHELDLALQLADTLWLMHTSPALPKQSVVDAGAAQTLLENGRFQEAFADDTFHFEHKDGQLRLVLTAKEKKCDRATT